MTQALSPGDRQLVPQNGVTVQLYRRPLGLDEPWEDERCGTRAGWNAHMYLGEKPCRPCKSAQAVYMREYRIRAGLTRHRVSVTQWHRDEARGLMVMCV